LTTFQRVYPRAKIVRRRVLVGWHWMTATVRHGKHKGEHIKRKVGGHWRHLRLVIHRRQNCTTRKLRAGRHRWTEVTVCRSKLKVLLKKRVSHGGKAIVDGLLSTGQGVPLAGVPVSVQTVPANGSVAWSQAAALTTNAAGQWTATLPAGPSRYIRAVYAGSETLLPAVSASAQLTVPAKIRIASITPRTLPWGSTLTIHGTLDGGYIPPGGENVQLIYGIGTAHTTFGVRTHVTTSRFSEKFTFGPGQNRERFWFELRALPTAAYAYAAASSNKLTVDVGAASRRGGGRARR
jgi:hypothetical protein